MGQYFYTVAALPEIWLGEKTPMSEEKFLQLAEDTLGDKEFRIISGSRLGSLEPTGFPFADRILAWERELRLELAKVRISGTDCSVSHQALPESDSLDVLTEKAKTALAFDSPLAAENYLNNQRWSLVDDMGSSHFFDLEFLVAYYFKLQIASRQEKLQKELGREAFAGIYETVKDSMP